MQRAGRILTGGLLVMLAGCQDTVDSSSGAAQNSALQQLRAADTEPVELPKLAPGTHRCVIRRDDGTELRFTLQLPRDSSADTKTPLIVALHYGGEVTPFYGGGMISALIEPAFGELNAIIVAPDSIAGTWTNDRNEAAVLQVMDSVIRSFPVDTSRVVLTGFSMGGEGTFYIGGRNQSRFSAVIPVAGRPTSDAAWTIPLYVVHSRADIVVPFEPTRTYLQTIRNAGADVELHAVDDLPHYNTPLFAEPLQTSVPWLLRIWHEHE